MYFGTETWNNKQDLDTVSAEYNENNALSIAMGFVAPVEGLWSEAAECTFATQSDKIQMCHKMRNWAKEIRDERKTN